MVTPSERQMFFDVWPFDALLGVSIGTLTEASDKVLHKVRNAPGSGSFRINRNSSEFTALCGTDNLIRVRLEAGGPFAYDDARYKFAFFIESGADNIVSSGEEGGEVVQLEGRTAEVILERAVIDYEAHYVDDIVNHPYDRTALVDGQWHFDEAISGSFSNIGTPGGVLRVLLRNAGAQVPEPIPEVTHTFSIGTASGGTAWENGDGRFDLEVGTDLLAALSTLVRGGLWYEFLPSLELSAWDYPPGSDLSLSVTFEKGVNIRETGVREINATPAKSRVLVKGSNGTAGGTLTYRWVSDTAVEQELGVRQGFLDYAHSPTLARLDKAGAKYLTDAKDWHDGPPTVGVVDYAGYQALVDYDVGDTVGVLLPNLPAVALINAIDLVDNETGTFDPVLTFVATPWAGHSSFTVPTHDPGGCPFFVHHSTSIMKMRPDYNSIYSHNGNVSGTDSHLSLTPAAGQLYSQAGGESAGVVVEGSGNIDFLASQYMFFNISAGTGNSSYYWFDGGYGIVFPFLTSDPGTAQSKAGGGQIYYNSASDKFRWWNGTAWADLSGGTSAGTGAPFEATSDPEVYRFISGVAGIASEDELAFLYLRPTSGDIEMYVDDLLVNAVTRIDLLANGGAAGGANTAKHFLTGGHGVVVPIGTANPGTAASENGQMYYNSTDHKFRGYANGTWVDFH